MKQRTYLTNFGGSGFWRQLLGVFLALGLSSSPRGLLHRVAHSTAACFPHRERQRDNVPQTAAIVFDELPQKGYGITFAHAPGAAHKGQCRGVILRSPEPWGPSWKLATSALWPLMFTFLWHANYAPSPTPQNLKVSPHGSTSCISSPNQVQVQIRPLRCS